jgi:hypothetical protein
MALYRTVLCMGIERSEVEDKVRVLEFILAARFNGPTHVHCTRRHSHHPARPRLGTCGDTRRRGIVVCDPPG